MRASSFLIIKTREDSKGAQERVAQSQKVWKRRRVKRVALSPFGEDGYFC
ncbi:hypothetical protein CVT26_000734, partial [Gymnopilus dilepis]